MTETQEAAEPRNYGRGYQGHANVYFLPAQRSSGAAWGVSVRRRDPLDWQKVAGWVGVLMIGIAFWTVVGWAVLW